RAAQTEAGGLNPADRFMLADALANAGDEAQALDLFRELAGHYRARSADGSALSGEEKFRLAYSVHALGNYERSADLFQQAMNDGANPALCSYNIARAFARLGETDLALAWLSRAVASGFVNEERARTDPDLESVRDTKRF